MTTTTIPIVQQRLHFALRLSDTLDPTRTNNDLLRFLRIGGYLAIQDDLDTWFLHEADYLRARDEIVGDLLDGRYDEQLAAGWPEVFGDAYADLTCNVSTIWTRIGVEDDLEALLHLALDPDQLQELAEFLRVEDELETLQRDLQDPGPSPFAAGAAD